VGLYAVLDVVLEFAVLHVSVEVRPVVEGGDE
jgi:hypothetical protein